MKITKSELREMIREALREELYKDDTKIPVKIDEAEPDRNSIADAATYYKAEREAEEEAKNKANRAKFDAYKKAKAAEQADDEDFFNLFDDESTSDEIN